MFGLSMKEWIIAAALALVIFSFTLLTGGIKVQGPLVSISDSYQMKRPLNTFFRKFDLSGREVQIEMVGQPQAVSGSGLVKSGVAAKTVSKQTTKQVVKQVVVDPKKKAKEDAAKKKAQAESRKKSKLSVAVVGASRTGLSGSVSPLDGVVHRFADGNSQPAVVNRAVKANPSAAKLPVAKEDDAEDAKLSAGQWLSLLQNQPSNENAVRFKKAKAYLGNKAYYYDVLAKLLVDSQADRQAFAYSLVKSDVSRETFYFLSNPNEELKKHETIFQKLNLLFGQYKTKNQFGILLYAMGIENTNSNLNSLSIVRELSSKALSDSTNDSVNNPTSGVVSASGTSAGSVSILKIDDFKVFEASVKKLETNQNEQVAQNARTLHSSLWQTGVVAGNQ